MTTKKVLALDLGSASIGWALVDEVEKTIVAAGVRIFPEGVTRDKSGGEVPKNQQRRQARGMRRQIARRAMRKRLLRAALVEAGLLPAQAALTANTEERRAWEAAEFKKADPYQLRRRALDEKLERHEIGRALLHLDQRRGFLSNRKADRSKKKENSEILEEISQLQAKITEAGDRSLGEHLAKHVAQDPLLRIRGQHTRREMFLQEFDLIWNAQRKYYPDLLTEQLKYGLRGQASYPCKPERTGGGARALLERFGVHGLMFFQRPIYWPKSVIGQCELDPKQKRCPRADRAAQEFRLLLEVNNLKIISADGEIKDLTDAQRANLLRITGEKESLKFEEIRKKLGLREGDGFNLESGDRRKLDGMATDAILGAKKFFGKEWGRRTDGDRNSIVRSLLHDDEATFIRRAVEEWNIAPDLARPLLDANLPDGYSSYGLETIERLLPFVRQRLPLTSNDGTPCAVREAGFLPPWERERKTGQYLPPPPEITNPLVRQALFEVRKLLNAVIREYGKPDAIHIELAREVKGTKLQRVRMSKQMQERRGRRDAAAERIRESGQKPTHNTIERYLLWEEQRYECMYSGSPISVVQLLGGEVDVDHILPYSKSLDDSLMNKVVCFRAENADKGQRTVHEWLAETNREKYEKIVQRAARLPIEIRNRKRPRFSQPTCELAQFINRQLTDTAYITSMVLAYIRCLGVGVVGSKGQLTAELRHQWGLNSILHSEGLDLKSREDHRHHAVDAIVIALTNQSRLQSLARYRGQERLPQPWEGFHADVQRIVNSIMVSHRANRKVAGALHEETLYGATQKRAGGTKENRPHAKQWLEEERVYVLRKPLGSLSLNEVEKIRDLRVRELVIARLAEFGLTAGRHKGADGEREESVSASGRGIPKKVWEKPLYLTARNGKPQRSGVAIHKVRLVKPENSIVPLGKKGGKFVKPGSLHHLAIFETTDAKGKVRRQAVFVSMLEAAARVRAKQPIVQRTHPKHPEARFIMSLSRGETVHGVFKGKKRLVRFLTAASTQGHMTFIEHTDARPSANVDEFAVRANTLNGNKVLVDILGRLHPASD